MRMGKHLPTTTAVLFLLGGFAIFVTNVGPSPSTAKAPAAARFALGFALYLVFLDRSTKVLFLRRYRPSTPGLAH